MSMDELIRILAEAKFIDEKRRQHISPDTSLRDDLRLDSFSTVLLVNQLEMHLGKAVDFSAFKGIETVEDLYKNLIKE